MAKASDEVVAFSNFSGEEKENFIVECVNKICNVDKSFTVCDWSTSVKTCTSLGLLLMDLLTTSIKKDR